LDERSEKYQVAAVLVMVFIAVVGAFVWLARSPGEEALVVNTPVPGLNETSETAGPEIKVYVTGAVLRPGVYDLPASARVEDATLMAGGLSIDANRELINLAALLSDGQHLHIPYLSASLPDPALASPSSNQGQDGLVNINAASAADLEKLPRIGPVTAEKIITYREEHGPFGTIEQLRDQKLVREADFEDIKNLITVQ
jgi:competence protein ComEA